MVTDYRGHSKVVERDQTRFVKRCCGTVRNRVPGADAILVAYVGAVVGAVTGWSGHVSRSVLLCFFILDVFLVAFCKICICVFLFLCAERLGC